MLLVWSHLAGAQTASKDAVSQAGIETELRQIEKLTPDDPDKALEHLRSLLTRIESNEALPKDRRQSLAQMLRDRIRIAEADKTRDLAARSRTFDRLAREEERDAEAQRAQHLFNAIKQLQREGKLGAASAQARDLGGRLPNSPAVKALERTTETGNQVAANRDLQRDKARAASAALQGVDRSAVPPTGDITFPKDWKEKTASRKPASAVRMTAREKAILRALDSPITVHFEASPLGAVLEYLRTLTGQPILVDPPALEAAGVTYDTKITMHLKDVSLRFVLRKILGDHGLAYIVKDEMIQVITAQQARDTMVTRVHYIGELITAADEVLATLQALQLINLIQTTIEPSSWKVNGGPGTIIYHHPTRSLIIKQSAEFHGTLAGGIP
jgi:hypothetical protein